MRSVTVEPPAATLVEEPQTAAGPRAPRWGSLDVLRGVALYMMVGHHMAKWTGGGVEQRFVGFEGLVFTDLAAPIFGVGVGAAAYLVGRRISAWHDGGRRRAKTALWRWTQVMLAGLAIDIAVGGGIDGGGVLPSLAVLGTAATALSALGLRGPRGWCGVAAACAFLVGPAIGVGGNGFFESFLNGSFSIAVYGVFAAAGAAVAAHAAGTSGGEEQLPLLRAAAATLGASLIGAVAFPSLLAPDGIWPPNRHPGYLAFTMWGLATSFAMWALVRRLLPSESVLGAAAARAGRRTLLLFMGHYVIKLALQHTGILGTLDTWRWGLVAWAAAFAVCLVASLPKPERIGTPSRGPRAPMPATSPQVEVRGTHTSG